MGRGKMRGDRFYQRNIYIQIISNRKTYIKKKQLTSFTTPTLFPQKKPLYQQSPLSFDFPVGKILQLYLYSGPLNNRYRSPPHICGELELLRPMDFRIPSISQSIQNAINPHVQERKSLTRYTHGQRLCLFCKKEEEMEEILREQKWKGRFKKVK